MSFTAYFWAIPAGDLMRVGRLWLRGVKGIFYGKSAADGPIFRPRLECRGRMIAEYMNVYSNIHMGRWEDGIIEHMREWEYG